MRTRWTVVLTTLGLFLGSLLAGCGTAAAVAHPAGTTTPPAAAPSVSPSPTPTSAAPSSPTTLHVVGLGDSVTSGEHCDCDDYVTGFGHLLTRRDGTKVVVTNDGESGSTSDNLADDLQHDHGLRSDVAQADVVVVTMGANDLYPALRHWQSGSCPATCYDPEVETMGGDLGRVLDLVTTLDHGRARVLVTTYWNVFTDGDVARSAERSGYLGWSDAVTRQANAAIAQVAATHQATLVDLYTPFKGDGSKDPTKLLASDGDHPDDRGTALISQAVLAAYEAGG